MPVGGLLEGTPDSQTQVFLKGFAIDGQADGNPWLVNPQGTERPHRFEHVVHGSMTEVLQIALGIHFHGGVDCLHREGGRHSEWQQRIDVAEGMLDFGPQGSAMNLIR
jgi:hypothetical protein